MDSVYAQAFAGLADNYYLLTLYSPEDRKARFLQANELAEKALEMLELASKANAVSPDETIFLEYKPLRSNPRFIAIREKMGLPPLEP